MDTARPDPQTTTSTSWWEPIPSYHWPSGATWEAFALAQAEALTKGMALWNEMWTRVATARSPLDYAVAGTLMWPACASQTMLYCKRLSDLASAAGVNTHDSTTIPRSVASVSVIDASTDLATTSCSPADNDATHVRPRASHSVEAPVQFPQFRGE